MKLYGKKWSRDFYKRFFLGMHMPDTDQNSGIPNLLSNFNAKDFIGQLTDAGCDTLYFYMSCHMGNCYYPSKVQYGRIHSGMKGRDFFGEVAAECVKEEIALVAVYEFANMHFQMKPHLVPADWNHYRKDDKGETVSMGLCWNGGYGDFVLEQLGEVAKDYPVVGFYIDMLDYPGRELCPACSKLFKDELDREPPTFASDITSPLFKEYKMWTFREVAKYLKKVRKYIREFIPEATVVSNHHYMIIEDLYEVTDAVDYVSTDPSIGYGHPGGRALARSTKTAPVFRSLSEGKSSPFDILYDNILMGLEQVMPFEPYLSIAANTMAHGGWPCQCSMWRRDGSLNPSAIGLAKEVNTHLDKVKPWVGNWKSLKSVGLYLSQETKFLYDNPGDKIDWFKTSEYDPCFLGAAMMLEQEHIIYDVLTKRQLVRLDDYEVIYLPNAVCLSKVEIAAFKDYVRRGGTLVSSYETSLADEWGNLKANFQMADVFGVDFTWKKITPYQALQMKMKNPEKYPFKSWENPSVTLNEPALIVKKHKEGVGVATLHDRYRPSSNPAELMALRNAFVIEEPDGPAIIENSYGRGRSIYFAGKVFAAYAFNKIPEIRQLAADWLIPKERAAAPVQLKAPGCVKISAFERPGDGQWIIHLVNNQTNPDDSYLTHKVPITDYLIPIHNMELILRPEEKKIKNVRMIVAEKELEITEEKDFYRLIVPKLQSHEVLVVKFTEKWQDFPEKYSNENIPAMIKCHQPNKVFHIKEKNGLTDDGWDGMGEAQ